MALIKLGALAQDARGSIAGTTFSKSRAGTTTRQKVSPVQPRTARQLAVRAILNIASKAWRNLDDAAQAAWTTWSNNHPIPNVFGDPMKLAPNAAYIRINADLANIAEVAPTAIPAGLTLPLSVPPADPVLIPAAATAVAADASSGDVTITLEAATTAGGFYAAWVTRGYSTGIKFVDSLLKLGGAVLEPVSGTTMVVNPSAVNPLINFAAGQKVTAVVCRYASTGKLIDTTRLNCVATA